MPKASDLFRAPRTLSYSDRRPQRPKMQYKHADEQFHSKFKEIGWSNHHKIKTLLAISIRVFSRLCRSKQVGIFLSWPRSANFSLMRSESVKSVQSFKERYFLKHHGLFLQQVQIRLKVHRHDNSPPRSDMSGRGYDCVYSRSLGYGTQISW